MRNVYPNVELWAPVPEDIRTENGKAGKVPGFAGVTSSFFLLPLLPHSSHTLISSSKGSKILFLESQEGVCFIYLVSAQS